MVLDELRQLAARPPEDGPRIRVITTSYMGATDPQAVEELSRLPNTEVRVSYDTKRTRLHAKAYIFHRETGFGSAYVGSANLSNAALSEGLEWTTKISQYELPYLWAKIAGTFDTYWQDDEFQAYSRECPRSSSAGNPHGTGQRRLSPTRRSRSTCVRTHSRKRSSTFWPPNGRCRTSTGIWSSQRPEPARR